MASGTSGRTAARARVWGAAASGTSGRTAARARVWGAAASGTSGRTAARARVWGAAASGTSGPIVYLLAAGTASRRTTLLEIARPYHARLVVCQGTLQNIAIIHFVVSVADSIYMEYALLSNYPLKWFVYIAMALHTTHHNAPSGLAMCAVVHIP